MKYIITYFTSFAILLLAIATFNWLIDPFGMYWSPQLENINAVKPKAGTRSRITKAYQLEKISPQVLIVGNSRVEMGIDPKSELFSGLSVYNQGMPGATLGMQVDYAIDAISENDSIEQILVGVDFLDFLIHKQKVTADNELAPISSPSYSFRLSSQDSVIENAKLLRLKEKLGLIFSLDALHASISTIAQQKSLASSISTLGFNSAASYVQIMNTEGIKPLFSQKLTEIKIKLQRQPWKITSQKAFPYSPIFAHLGRLIDAAHHKKIKITFFINPYHSSYLHTLADNNQWNNFELWKETLIKYLDQKQETQFSLWDFSSLNSITNEAVPLATPKKQMLWFWEPAHYKKELGERLLARLLSPEKGNQDRAQKDTFGVFITPKNIRTQAALNRQQLKNSLPQWQYLQTQLKI